MGSILTPTFFLWCSVVLLALTPAALLFLFLYRHKQHRSIFAAMLEGQEQERRRLARELHEGLGGTMANIKLNVSRLREPEAATAENRQIDGILLQLDGATHELRRIARHLMPETLLKFGLETALKDLCEGLHGEGPNIVFQCYGLQSDIPQAHQLMIYRLVQELVVNAVRHAAADKILVQCMQRDHELSITVEDDGRGFDGHFPHNGHTGLINMRNRVHYLKGRLDIQSMPGIGTTVNIEVSL
jgi:two-component system NarL family sensor kinase